MLKNHQREKVLYRSLWSGKRKEPEHTGGRKVDK